MVAGPKPRPTMPLRRILALALLLTTMSAPLALTLCQVECAHAASGRAAVQHHSCHESGEPASVSISAVPHFCGHTDEAPTGLEQAQKTFPAPVAVIELAAWTPAAIATPVVEAEPQHSPPRPFALLSQLRL